MTLRFFVEIQFEERGLVERGLVETSKSDDWWKETVGGKSFSWKLDQRFSGTKLTNFRN